MALPLDTAVLAVDGGGSGCRMALEAGARRFAVEAGPANVSTDADAAADTLKAALARLAGEVGTAPGRLAALPAYLGLAGVLGPEDAEALARRLPFRNVRIEDDRPAALEGALGPRGTGAVAHCGTGSFLGFRGKREIRFAGGWGHRLGDEASATWLARCALSATLDAIDRLLPHTALTETLSARLSGARGIVAFSLGAAPEAYGALAPLVTEAAMDGDPTARRIMKEGAAYIGRTLAALGWHPGDRLCLTGGVGPAYAHYLPAALREALTDPAGTPIDGALALARAHFKDHDP